MKLYRYIGACRVHPDDKLEIQTFEFQAEKMDAGYIAKDIVMEKNWFWSLGNVVLSDDKYKTPVWSIVVRNGDVDVRRRF
jgi:hypothetical protein